MPSNNKITLISELEKRGFWDQKIKSYYESKMIKKLIKKTQKNHSIAKIPAADKKIIVQNCKKSGDWKPVLCDFGESCASWYLETKEQIHFVKLRWVIFPFTIMQGIDLVGYKNSTEEICCAEAKTKNDSSVSSTISALCEELKDDRIRKFLDSPINRYGSKECVVQDLLDSGKISPEQAKTILDKSNYLRYGFLFHPKRNKKASFQASKDILHDNSGPVTLIDYELEDLNFEIGSFLEVVSVSLEGK